jgi:hypothetical protein
MTSSSTQPRDPQRNLRLLRVAFWSVALLADFLQVWPHRFSLTPDTTNYLDISAAYLRADWHTAVNAYWSPLLSWLLALAIGIFHPSAYLESTLVHLLSFFGFVVALLGLEYFVRGICKSREATNNAGAAALPELGFWVLAYALFLSTSLVVVSPAGTTPDIWVCAFTYFSVGLLVRVPSSPRPWLLFAFLGAACAGAYFAKTFYFPLSFVVFFAGWLAAGASRKALKPLALAAIVFSLLTLPWLWALSKAKGRFTFGDVGKMAFATAIDRIQQPLLWQGENNTGTPKHPVHLLRTSPRVFDFSSHPLGTYPPSFDWSYWMDGVAPRFSSCGLLLILRQSAGTYYQIFLAQVEYAIIGMVLLVLASRSELFRNLRKLAHLWSPPMVACAAYAIVLVEPRYVAPFIPILWIAALCSLFRAASDLSPRVAMALVLAAVSVTGLKIARQIEIDAKSGFSAHRNTDAEIGQALADRGLRPGDRVSILNAVEELHWARQAGLTVVSEIPSGDAAAFWAQTPDAKQDLFRILASTGAKMIVTNDQSGRPAREGWIQLGSTSFFAYPLPVRSRDGRDANP